jgi:hypothetical protein
LVGNTCVLLDRDPRAAERRQIYGRAGEYRLPDHGLEYRTLSNFWLRAYPLFSLVMGLSRLAVSVVYSSYGPPQRLPIVDAEKSAKLGYDYFMVDPKIPHQYLYHTVEPSDFVSELLGAVDQASIVKAINENDFDLALENFKAVRGWLQTLEKFEALNVDNAWPLGNNVWDEFDYFVSKGLNHWFHADPFTSWLPRRAKNNEIGNNSGWNGHGIGWEAFLLTIVRNRMEVENSWSKQKAS